jgi:hypothetical protein
MRTDDLVKYRTLVPVQGETEADMSERAVTQLLHDQRRYLDHSDLREGFDAI